MSQHKYGLFFRLGRRLARILLPTFRLRQIPERLDEPIVFVSHHQNMMGPFSIMIWLPFPVRLWALSFMADEEECYRQFAEYTFPKRLHLPQSLANLLAYPSAKVSTAMLKSIGMIPVYRQSRQIVVTMRESIKALKRRDPLLIFPDINYQQTDDQVGDIYEGFLNLEKYYYRREGERISFVPIYSNIEKRLIRIGHGLQFPHKEDFVTERQAMAEKLRESLNALSQLN